MTLATSLIQSTRRFIGDWPENDALTASTASNASTLTVADATLYSQGWIVQVDSEAMYVTANGVGTTVTVRRGVRGSVAASHASAATVLVRPHFLDLEYLDALNAGIDATFPFIYKSVVDESITTSSSLYEYTVPNLNPGEPIRMLSRISLKETADLAYRRINHWDVMRGATPKIRFRRYLPEGTLRIEGYSPIPQLTSATATLDSLYPAHAVDALWLFAAQWLLASGEARRVREDTGSRDDRENANRLGGSMSASQQLLQRFQLRLLNSAMPPMPKHVKSVI